MELIEKISLEEENYKKFLEDWSKNTNFSTNESDFVFGPSLAAAADLLGVQISA